MKKRVFAALLTLTIALALLPSAALAAPGALPTEVYVGATNVTTYATATALCGGTVQYNAVTGVLTLNGVTVTAGDYYDSAKAAIYADGDLVIELVGASTVTGPDWTNYSCGVAVVGNLTIRGDGQLIATGGDVANNFSAGVHAEGDITISGGTVKGVGKVSPDVSAGVFANTGGITITGGTVLAESGNTPISLALNTQPGFGTNTTWYRWRTGASGDYTVSERATQYDWDVTPKHTYVEIRPVELTPVLTGGSAAFSEGAAAQDAAFTIGAGVTGFNKNDHYDHTAVGGQRLTDSQVAAAEGSIKLTFSRAYLNTLPAGTHTATVYLKGQGYAGRTVAIQFTVHSAAIPDTGDTAAPYLWTGLALLSIAGLVVLRRRRRID